MDRHPSNLQNSSRNEEPVTRKHKLVLPLGVVFFTIVLGGGAAVLYTTFIEPLLS